MPLILQTPRRTTKYDTEGQPRMMKKDKMRPRWTIEIIAKDRFEWEIYEAMVAWLDENIKGYRAYNTLAGGRSIRAVTFPQYMDAMLFYMRFR